MRFLHDYIDELATSSQSSSVKLSKILSQTRSKYDVHSGGKPTQALEAFVDRYNWLGQPSNKSKYGITANFARNLPGALMQDYLLHLVIELKKPYPDLDVFTEVRIPFGSYPLWEKGYVEFQSPSERSDTAIGYLIENSQFVINDDPWPKEPFYKIEKGQSVMPIVTINSKIRVSQSEFFDWFGREQLMTKGNPHCLSIQVALRKEMDMKIVEAAQASDKFFLLGEGTERNVVPDRSELTRLIDSLSSHLMERML